MCCTLVEHSHQIKCYLLFLSKLWKLSKALCHCGGGAIADVDCGVGGWLRQLPLLLRLDSRVIQSHSVPLTCGNDNSSESTKTATIATTTTTN